jgi:hypothetical protein
MIYVLNNLTPDYDLHHTLMEKGAGDKEKPVTVDETRAELTLHFERISMKFKNLTTAKSSRIVSLIFFSVAISLVS